MRESMYLCCAHFGNNGLDGALRNPMGSSVDHSSLQADPHLAAAGGAGFDLTPTHLSADTYPGILESPVPDCAGRPVYEDIIRSPLNRSHNSHVWCIEPLFAAGPDCRHHWWDERNWPVACDCTSRGWGRHRVDTEKLGECCYQRADREAWEEGDHIRGRSFRSRPSRRVDQADRVRGPRLEHIGELRWHTKTPPST